MLLAILGLYLPIPSILSACFQVKCHKMEKVNQLYKASDYQ